MKWNLRARSLLTAVALSIVGCDPAEPKSEGPPKPEEHEASKLGPPSPEPPVMPSPMPQLPATTKAGRMEDEKKAAEKKDEPKLEPPK